MSLRELREQQKLRQVDVAKKLRVEQSTISYVNTGNVVGYIRRRETPSVAYHLPSGSSLATGPGGR